MGSPDACALEPGHCVTRPVSRVYQKHICGIKSECQSRFPTLTISIFEVPFIRHRTFLRVCLQQPVRQVAARARRSSNMVDERAQARTTVEFQIAALASARRAGTPVSKSCAAAPLPGREEPLRCGDKGAAVLWLDWRNDALTGGHRGANRTSSRQASRSGDERADDQLGAHWPRRLSRARTPPPKAAPRRAAIGDHQ